MSGKWKIIAGTLLILAVFLAGFVPQFFEKRRLRTELESTRARISEAQQQIEIDEIRRLAGWMFLEASRQNYGTARERSAAYFNKLRALADRSDNASLKNALLQLLNSRDAITSGLAQGNPSIISELQSLLEGTYNIPDAENVPR